MSTRFEHSTRVPGAGRRAAQWGGRGSDPAEEVALVAHAARRRLLSLYRQWLRWEDLEDCYSQATLELVAQARRGEPCRASRARLRGMLELRFVSRVRDRRRALRGRSPAQAMLDGALSLGGVGGREVEIADPRADLERRMMLRWELVRLERAARALSPDQRLVLACQVGLRMSAGEFCATFGWSLEKHRKVAQRARTRLRGLMAEPAGCPPEDEGSAGNEAERGAEEIFSKDRCPALGDGSVKRAGTNL